MTDFSFAGKVALVAFPETDLPFYEEHGFQISGEVGTSAALVQIFGS